MAFNFSNFRGVEKEQVQLTIKNSLTIPNKSPLVGKVGKAGSIIWDEKTGKFYISDGLNWIEVSLGGIPTADLTVDGNLTVVGNSSLGGTATLNDLIVTGTATLNDVAVTGNITIESYRLTAAAFTMPAVIGPFPFSTYIDPSSAPAYFTSDYLYVAPVTGVYFLTLSGTVEYPTSAKTTFTLSVQKNEAGAIPQTFSNVNVGATVGGESYYVSMNTTRQLNQTETLNIHTDISGGALDCKLYLTIYKIQ